MSISQSTSTPVVVPTTENALIDQLSGVAAGLANQMYQWAQGAYAKTSQVTDAAVGNFFQVSQKMLGLSTNLTDQYNNLFAPENAQLVADANSYNSVARQKVDMGAAGATQAQAGEAALRNSEEALRSYGINPSDGRYAALDKAAAVQNAANIAGAENMQRDRDVQIGQGLRRDAVQVGAQLPAAIANVNNTAIQANTGASNASLANANTGANLMRLPNDYLSTAMNIKLPPVGQKSQSTSGTSGGGITSNGWPQGGGSSGGGGAGASAAPGSGASSAAWMPQHGGGGTGGPAIGGGSGNPGPKFTQVPGQGDYDPSSVSDFWNGPDAPDFGYLDGGQGSMGIGDPGANGSWDSFQGGTANPFEDPGFGQTYDYGGANQTYGNLPDQSENFGGYGDYTYSPSANYYDPGWDNTYDQPSASTDWGTGAEAYNDYGYTQGSDYARGGPIPGGPPHAGPVPRQMSPSGGQQVDDVRAQGPQGAPINLNANEFVVPQDVALWKGQEFFQNLINQSRMKLATASAKPSAAPPAQGTR